MSEALYENPDIYDIAYTEKVDEMIAEHYKNVFTGKDIETIHDCSFGTGNLSIVLARMGYKLSGSDISGDMLEKAGKKIKEEGLAIDLVQSDFRELTANVKNAYDCVMSTGNSLAHVNNADVVKAIYEMSKLVNENGYIYIDSRNWDKIRDTKHGTITFNFLYSFEKDNKILRHEEFAETYHPLSIELIVDSLHKLGFGNFEIHNFGNAKIHKFEDMQWYSIIARKLS